MNQRAPTSRRRDPVSGTLTLQRLANGRHTVRHRSPQPPVLPPSGNEVSLVLAARDDERRRLARDLHDGLQQDLVVLRMRLGLLRERRDIDVAAQGVWDELANEVDQMIGFLRDLSNAVFPPSLIDRGLTSALRSYLSRVPLQVALVSDPDPLPRLAPEIEASAYFLALEAVTNALKHAEASRIEVSLRLVGAGLEVRVGDDGRGFQSPLEGGAGRGLKNMAERVNGLGGRLELSCRRGGGAEVRAWFPVTRARIGDAEPAKERFGRRQMAEAAAPSGR